MQKFIFLLCCLLTGSLYAQQTNVFNVDHAKVASAKHKLSPADVSDYVISDNYVSSTTGVRNVYLKQQYQGTEIYNAIMGIHIGFRRKSHPHDFEVFTEIEQKNKYDNANFTPEEALAAAAQHLNIQPPANLKLIKDGVFSEAGISQNEIPFNLIYQLAENGQINICWNFVIKEIKSANWWDLRVDANTGEVLDKTNWTVTCNWDHGGFDNPKHLHTAACSQHRASENNTASPASMNQESYNVYPIGVESPNHGLRAIVDGPADAFASPFGWHDTNGNAGAEYTITRGNNVYAYEDRNNTDSPGFSPDGGVELHFDFPLDATQSPVVSESAVLTNLFYWNNIMHDVWYQYGFDEASGNFQSNNYGNGGAGGDHVLAEAQDGSGTNNANFSTPGDGGNGRMQMYLWSGVASSSFTVNAPDTIASPYFSVVGSFGPAVFNVTGDLVIVDDGAAAPSEGCSALINGADVNGNIAVVDRGACEFGRKALNAQNAGAIAVIVCNNVAGGATSMAPGADGASVTIPTIMISQEDCQTIRMEIPVVNVTMSATGVVDFDSDLDNGIIAHEYGHGISTRLTGGPNTSCLSSTEQMGEGWSDWLGLMVTMNVGDVGTTGRGVGTYVQGQPISGGGIRTHRYSTDMTVNPHTYNDIGSESVPHGIGSVWCAMIWDMTWALIDEYGFDPDYYYGTGGNNIAMALVLEGMKLQGCSPGFIDGRDGILAADQVLFGGANTCTIWSAFARRGLGFGASQGSVNSATDGTESYAMPPSCNLSVTKTVDQLSAGPSETVTYSITVSNTFGNELTNVVVTDDLPLNTIYVEGSASNGGVLSGNTVVYPAVTLAVDEVVVFTFSAIIDPGTDVSLFTTLEDAETTTGNWTAASSAPGTGNWGITPTNPYAGTGVWFAQDFNTPNEQYLTISDAIMPSATSVLKFWHSFDTEVNWDGCWWKFLRIAGVWQDMGALFTLNGYNDFIDNTPSKPAFSGTSGGYIESNIDLGSFEDQTVFVRFWMHCDPAVGGVGWYVDNIEITDLNVIVPNTVVVSADGLADVSASMADVTKLVSCDNCTHCNDGILNEDEVAIDCGGATCEPCIEGCMDAAAHNYDATAQVDNGTCETCSDGIMNGDEEAVDCGGLLCMPCAAGCLDMVVLDDPFITNVQEYRANIQIRSAATISDSSDVYFIAGDNIELNGGFEVELGSSFLAGIGACDDPPILPLNGENASSRLEKNDLADKVSLNVEVTKAGMLEVNLYNLTGELMKNVQQSESFEIGKHHVIFDVANLPSGVYQLIAKVGDEQFATRLVID